MEIEAVTRKKRIDTKLTSSLSGWKIVEYNESLDWKSQYQCSPQKP